MGKFGSSKPDTPQVKFGIGDKVRFDSSQSEVYSYEVPETNEIGIIQLLSLNIPLNQLLGVEMEMALVRFDSESTEVQMERMIYLEHLKLIERGSGKITGEASSAQDPYNQSNVN